MVSKIVREGETTNFDLEQICMKLNVKLKGIYLKNQLLNIKPVNGCYIVNMSDVGEGGTHWFCIYIENKKAVVFDSFGVAPADEVLLFLYTIPKVFYNKQQVQEIKSSACGWYCVLFLYMTSNSKDPFHTRIHNYQKLFSKVKLIHNDSKLYKYMDMLI